VNTARQRLGGAVLIGISAHSDADIAAAAAAGADYVTLSPIYPTASKPGYGPALGLSTISAATRHGIPIVALGGIAADRVGPTLGAGAAAVAVMGTVMRADDPERMCEPAGRVQSCNMRARFRFRAAGASCDNPRNGPAWFVTDCFASLWGELCMGGRVICLAIALCGAAAASANAADQSVSAAPRAPSYYPNSYFPPAVLWQGFYVGLNLGGAFSSASWTDPYSGLSNNPMPASLLGGAQIGVNWQWNTWVLGIEADGDYLKLDSSATNSFGETLQVRDHWLFTTTGRVGYAAGQWLYYVKGGAAFVGERDKAYEPTFVASTSTVTQVGPTVGAGVEYAFTNHLSGRLEYDFMYFRPEGLFLNPTIVYAGTPATNTPANVDWTIHRVLAAVNYRF
jgi:opacity protein-like surface antigen